MGRGKIEIKRIENLNNRQVTYSKRRNGLIKKAKEISVLCDAKVSLIIVATSGKMHDYCSAPMFEILEGYHKQSGKKLWDARHEVWIMAPGAKRRHSQSSRQNEMVPRCNPTLIDSYESSNEDEPVLKKNVRRKSRGVGCERLLHLSKSKLNIDFEVEDGRPTGIHASRLSTEIGIIVRTFAPLQVDQWRRVPSDKKKEMFDRVTNKFHIDTKQPHVVRFLNGSMARRFKGFKYFLKQKFKKFSNLAEAIQNRPEEVVNQEDWEHICKRFDSDLFKQRSKIYMENRKKLKFGHRGGSKPFVQHQKEMAKRLGHTPGPISLFHDTHWSMSKGWSNDEAKERYEKMLELQEQSIAEGSEPISETEICEEVLGRSSGYVKGLGFGPLPQSHTSFRQTTTELQQKIERQNEEIEGQRTQLQNQSEKIQIQSEEIKQLQEQNLVILDILKKLSLPGVELSSFSIRPSK